MNSRDNLRQAAKDFFGLDASNGAALDGTAATKYGESGMTANMPDGSVNMSEMVVLEPRKQTSVIAEGTSITGRVRTTGHIEVMGKVDGNIEADGDVTICGKVSGNIKGDQLRMLNCQVKGNLDAENRVLINSESVILGDVSSDSLVLDGKLKGNVNVTKAAVFNSNSYLLGDITTATLSIDAGAVINGMVRTQIDYDAESPFDKM